MDKDKGTVNSTFDFDDDPEFSANFMKNIELALGESKVSAEEAVLDAERNTNDKDDVTFEMIDIGKQAKNTVVAADERKNEKSFDTTNLEDTETILSKQMGAEDIDDQLIDINAELARQICEEMETIVVEKTKKKKLWWLKIKGGVALTLLLIVGLGFFLGFTKPGNNLLMGMGINLGGTIWAAWTGSFDNSANAASDIDYVEDEDINAKGDEIDPSTIMWPNTSGEGRHEEGVYNILLLGEEAIGSGDARGRTDVIVIATMNTKNNTIKLTSLMRDMLVQIPGFKDNKLNVAYEEGGLDLMYQTIALNLDLKLDGCVMVNFENFERIIDELGGLKINLTEGEAKYLNTTNYISNRENRNVITGTQIMNGNQVLGYARVRKRATITGNNNDYGRTDRHRIILNAIFEKYKTTSKTDLAKMMVKFLPMITTDIDSKAFQLFLNSYVEMGTTRMEQLRIPADGTFQDNVKVRGMAVLIPDYHANIDVLHGFIFGEENLQGIEGTNETGTTGVTQY